MAINGSSSVHQNLLDIRPVGLGEIFHWAPTIIVFICTYI